MQNLIRLLEEFRSESPPPTPQDLLHRVREYLQILILKSVYHSKFGRGLSFMGGTCLRICYHLKRYSEDLDFALDQQMKNYSFQEMVKNVTRSLEATAFKVECSIEENDIVQKSFLKFPELLQRAGLSERKGQKLHLKLEVDTRPIKVTDAQRESFFVNKYNEIFPLLKHKIETLFAGKLLAILSRTYTKGRDYYDLIWYLSKRTPIDWKYLREGIAQNNKNQQKQLPSFKTPDELFGHLATLIRELDTDVVLKDIGRFLEDPQEERWIKDYERLFTQLTSTSS